MKNKKKDRERSYAKERWSKLTRTEHICPDCKSELVTEHTKDVAECKCKAVKLIGSRLYVKKIMEKYA